MVGLKINLPSFESVDKSNLSDYGIFDGTADKFEGQKPYLINFVQQMYSAKEGESILDGINSTCNIAYLHPESLDEYKKYAKMFYPNNIKCDWAKSGGSQKAV